MALSCTNRGTGTHNTGATSFTLSPTSNLTAGAMAVLCVAADNSSAGGSTNNITNVTDSLGNTWTRRQLPIFDNGAANAGVQGVIATTNQNKGAITTGTTITVSFGASTVAKTWTMTEVTSATNTVVRFITGANGTGQSGTTAPTITSGSITSGDAIIAAIFLEAGTTESITTDDTDTSNGTWGNSSVSQYAEVGATTSGSVIASNFKVTTGTGTQTYNLTIGVAADAVHAWIQLRETAIVVKDMIGSMIPFRRI